MAFLKMARVTCWACTCSRAMRESRSSLYEGECIRDASIGVPYQRTVLGQSDADLAASSIVAEVSGAVTVRRTERVLR